MSDSKLNEINSNVNGVGCQTFILGIILIGSLFWGISKIREEIKDLKEEIETKYYQHKSER